ncbi:MAG TPA: hypothetical protein VEQ42_00560 [Pyrinomonadaceae bacterium]|nr:hypothetical protein [Pyrinomonadaceae bacterium]
MFRTEAELAQVRSLPFVTGARPYSIDQTVRPDFLHALEAAEKSAGDDAELLPNIAELLPASGRQDEQAESDREVFHVVCHRAKDLGRSKQVVRRAAARCLSRRASPCVCVQLDAPLASL